MVENSLYTTRLYDEWGVVEDTKRNLDLGRAAEAAVNEFKDRESKAAYAIGIVLLLLHVITCLYFVVHNAKCRCHLLTSGE